MIGGSAEWAVECSDSLAWLKTLPDGCVQCAVTSPPYFALRDYGADGQIGLEETPLLYVNRLVELFRELRRVLRSDGTFWLNIGDSYCNAGSRNNGTGLDGKRRGGVSDTDGTWEDATESYRDIRHALKGEGIKHKDLMGIPWMLAFALRADGWYLRQECQWCKTSPMPESVTDRPTKAHEQVFLLTKKPTYYYDQEAERVGWADERQGWSGYSERGNVGKGHADDGTLRNDSGVTLKPQSSGRNLWSWWADISPSPVADAHFATMPESLARRCLRLGTSERGCCRECGAPWKRILERKKVKRERPNDYTKRQPDADGIGNKCANSVAGVSTSTTGWEPSCDCIAGEPVPCLILDPFAGSGTTLLVARQLGLRGIGSELNPEYTEMARRRIRNALSDVKPKLLTGPTMFDGIEET